MKKNVILLMVFGGLTTWLYSQEVSLDFTVSDQQGGSKVLSVGLDPTATDGIDPSLGEELLPPVPPSGTFDARVNLNDSEASLKDYRNGSSSYVGSKVYELQYQPSSGKTIVISWNMPSNITGNLKDKLGGVVVDYDFGSGPDSYTITNADVIDKLDLTINYNAATAVELYSFEVELKKEGVLLKWLTKTEVNNYGFEIQRNYNNKWEKVGFVQGAGTSNVMNSYEFLDKEYVYNHRIYYRLKSTDLDGSYDYSNEVSIKIDKDIDVQLYQNYPNPFNPVTNISVYSQGNMFLELFVVNSLGQRIATLYKGVLELGKYNFMFDGSGFPSGLYFSVLKYEGKIITKKMLLIK